jgi:phage shock protein PspC (stress-responsive transcriptional regulator)
MSQTKLHRSHHRILGGVCGGIAEYLGWDRLLVRLLYVIVSVLSAAFPGTIVYIVLWIVMPMGSKGNRGTVEQQSSRTAEQ